MTGIGSSSWSWKEAMFEVPCGGWLVGWWRRRKGEEGGKEIEGEEV